MKILIFFSFFQLLSSQIHFRGYQTLAEEKNWSKTQEAYNDYASFCTSEIPLIPPNHGGEKMTKADCDTKSLLVISEDGLRCPTTISQTVEITTPKISTIQGTSTTTETTTSPSQTSTILTTEKLESTSTQQTSTSFEPSTTLTPIETTTFSSLGTEGDEISYTAFMTTTALPSTAYPETPKSITTETATAAKTYSESQSSTPTSTSKPSSPTTVALAKEQTTATETLSSIPETTTSLQNDPLSSSSPATTELSQLQTRTLADVSSSVKSTKLTEKPSAIAKTRKTRIPVTSKATTLRSTYTSPSTTLKKTSKLQTVTSTTQQSSTRPSTPVSTQKQTTRYVSESASKVETTTVPQKFDTTKTSRSNNIEKSTVEIESSPVSINSPTKTYTIKSTNVETSKIENEEQITTSTFFDNTLPPSTVSSTSAPSTTKTNELWTDFSDDTSDTSVTSTAVYSTSSTTTETPTTSTTTVPLRTTATKLGIDRSSEATENEKTESQTSTITVSKTVATTTPTHTTTTSPIIDATTAKSLTSTVTSSQQFIEIPQTTSTTTSMPSTRIPEVSTTTSYTTVAPSPTTPVSISESTTIETQIATTPLPTPSTITDSDAVTSTTTPTSGFSTVVIKETTVNEGTTTVNDEASTISAILKTKLQPITAQEQSTTPEASTSKMMTPEITTSKKVEQQTSTKKTFQEITVPLKSTLLTTIISEVEQTTVKQTPESAVIKTTNIPTTSSSASTSSASITEKYDITTEESAESTFDPTTDPDVIAYWGLSPTTPKTPTTKKPSCKNPCQYGFYEGDFACFKFIQANKTEEWGYSDFENACLAKNGVIASWADFSDLKTNALIKKMSKSKNFNSSLTFINPGAPTLHSKRNQLIPAIEIAKLSSTKIPMIGLSPTKKYSNLSIVCRVGKYCESYTCPTSEYFIQPEARFLEAYVPPTTVLKTDDVLNVFCTTKQTFIEVKCDRKGFLTPHSSFVNCISSSENKNQENGTVKSCAECDIEQTASCDDNENGTFYCNCSTYYTGATCKFLLNACSNVTCQNDGTCINQFSHAYCQCKAANFGRFCEYLFYAHGPEDEAWIMKMIVNIAIVVVVVEQTVETKRSLLTGPPSRFGGYARLPTECCRGMALGFSTIAFAIKLVFESPDSSGIEEKFQCMETFRIAMAAIFTSLTAMIAEAIISLAVISNKCSNNFHDTTTRKRCVSPSKLFILITFFSAVPTAIIWQNAGEMVTSRSCMGILPFEGYSDSKQMAGLLLVVLMGTYALTASCLALFSRQFLDYNPCETRRRYDLDLVNPYIYGREVLPVELNIRYFLLALKPILFVLTWFSAIAALELMTKEMSYLAAAMAGLHSVVSFLQNSFTLPKGLKSNINHMMNWLPACIAPKYNFLTLWKRDDYLRILDPKKYEREQIKKLNNGPEAIYPILYPENVQEIVWAGVEGVINAAGIRKVIPSGRQQIYHKIFKSIYYRARKNNCSRKMAMRRIWLYIVRNRNDRLEFPHAAVVELYKTFRKNMFHLDQFHKLKPAERHVIQPIFQLGLDMLTIKPVKELQIADILDPESGRTLTFIKNDPAMSYVMQKKAYKKLEDLCNRITPAAMARDEARTRTFEQEFPYLAGTHQDILSGLVIDNRRFSLMDLMLDERRPNFIGPRTLENQLPPGLTRYEHTTYFMMNLNIDIWNRVITRAKYEQFHEIIKEAAANLGGRSFWPWNWFRGEENPNLIPGFQFGELPQNPNPEEAHDPLDPLGLN